MKLIEQAIGKHRNSDKPKQPRQAVRRSDINKIRKHVVVPTNQFDDTGLPLLTEQELEEKRILRPGMKDSHVENSLVSLRTALLRRSEGKPATVLVTACDSGCGNRFISTNLAAAIARDEHLSSILVDSHLRADNGRYEFLTDQGVGLSDFIFGDVRNVQDILQPVGIERMRLIPSGSNAQQHLGFLTSAKINTMIGAIRDAYSGPTIVFDAPPVATTPTARILADECDFVILVAGYGETSNQSVAASLDHIAPEKLLGIVLNKEPKLPFGAG